MIAPSQYGANRRNDEDRTVLVLTDGSVRAEQVAEWGLVFTGLSRATVHRIDVVKCLDSGIIIHRYEGRVPNEHGSPGRQLAEESTDVEGNRSCGHEPTIDVLHGVPHEALRDYVAANAIDLVVIGACKRTGLGRSLAETAFTRFVQTTTVPVVTVGSGVERLRN